MSDNPPRGRFASVVARLQALHPKLIDLSLGRMHTLLGRLDHPEAHLPPVVHVAGTNGKGSTCAFLRAIGEAAGWRVHVYTSPHLVRFNERIRVAGRLVDDDSLQAALDEVESRNAGAPITVFEVLTAAALLLFARTPAELVVLEVGLGGRYDATNVVPRPAVSAITSISLDHREFLGGTLAAIAGEKAGILKAGVPAVSGTQTPVVAGVLAAEAARIGTQLACRGRDWQIRPRPGGLLFEDARGSLALPAPLLPGEHQWDNAGIAIAALRTAFAPPAAAYAQGLLGVNWPARLQRLHGALAATLPAGCELWLDGGHNPGAGVALARHLAALDGPTHLIIGMKQGKDLDEFLRPLLPLAASLWAVAEPGQHLACSPAAIVAASGGLARPGPTVAAALAAIAARVAPPARVLICGSLYLAGEVLKADGTPVI